MKPIENSEVIQRRRRRNQLIMGITLMGIMVLSSIGFAFTNNFSDSTTLEKKKINGITFNLQNDRWVSRIEGQEFNTKFKLEDLSSISIENQMKLKDFIGKPLYFVGERGDHFSEIELNIGSRFVQRIQLACISNESCEGNLPIKDCTLDNIIVYKESKEGVEKIYQKDHCVYIESSIQNQALYADALLFNILGISL